MAGVIIISKGNDGKFVVIGPDNEPTTVWEKSKSVITDVHRRLNYLQPKEEYEKLGDKIILFPVQKRENENCN